MLRFALGLFAVFAFCPSAQAFDHSPFDALLKKHVEDGKVDYAGVRADRKALEAYLAQLAAADVTKLSSKERYAFWINAYNALTWKRVIDSLPRDPAQWGTYKVTEVDGGKFWKQPKFSAGGKQVTLDEIEHKILRPTWKDARVHFAVNCASVGCPVLRAEAFTAAKLDAQLDDAAKTFVRTQSKLQLDPANKTLRINKIFEWFKDDFVKDAGSVEKFLARYVDDAATAKALREGGWKISYLEYDWHLNKQ